MSLIATQTDKQAPNRYRLSQCVLGQRSPEEKAISEWHCVTEKRKGSKQPKWDETIPLQSFDETGKICVPSCQMAGLKHQDLSHCSGETPPSHLELSAHNRKLYASGVMLYNRKLFRKIATQSEVIIASLALRKISFQVDMYSHWWLFCTAKASQVLLVLWVSSRWMSRDHNKSPFWKRWESMHSRMQTRQKAFCVRSWTIVSYSVGVQTNVLVTTPKRKHENIPLLLLFCVTAIFSESLSSHRSSKITFSEPFLCGLFFLCLWRVPCKSW